MNSRIFLALCASTIAWAIQCQQPTGQQTNDTSVQTDTLNLKQPEAAGDGLVVTIRMDGEYSLVDSLPLHFTVYNPTDDTLRFTKYHTPFEGFLNKIFDITDSDGNEVAYIGPMARRVMPPVEESYRTVLPQSRDTVTIDLKKGYQFEAPGTYTVQFNGGAISGVDNGEPIRVEVKE